MTYNTSLTGKLWKLRGEKSPEESIFEAFCRIRSLSEEYLQIPTLENLSLPEEIPGMKEGGERILEAIKNKEKILLFGDFDLDGASGVATLYMGLKTLGADVIPKLPMRNEGHGLSKGIMEKAKKHGVSLIITIDCGSGNGEEIEYGNRLGIDTVITDHHTLPEDHPSAFAIIHPHLGEKDSEIWDLTGAGVAFFVAKYLLEKIFPDADLSSLLKKLAELAVLGTVADVGELKKQNRVLTILGLQELKKTSHPGLKALFKTAELDQSNLTAETIAFFIAPRLNAAGRLDDPNIALSLLLGSEQMAQNLHELNLQRQDVTADLSALAEQQIEDKNAPAIIVYHDDFFPGVSGLIASKLAEKFHRPAVVFAPSDDEETLVASCRGPEDFHLAHGLREVEHLLRKYGGHTCAAGCVMEKAKLHDFIEHFHRVVEKKRGKNPPVPFLEADYEVEAEAFFTPEFRKIFSAAPFGAGNPDPIFYLRDVPFHDLRIVGKDQTHISGKIMTKKGSIRCIAFRFAEHISEEDTGKRFDILIVPEISRWNGREEVKGKIVDIALRAEKRK